MAAMPPSESTPLQNKWTLWYDNPRTITGDKTWLENLKLISNFDTAEAFWTSYNNVLPSSKLTVNSNYHLFKGGVKPMWEDESNKNGGKWIITIPKSDSRKGKVDEWWLYTVLAMVGETMDESGMEVCGAVVSIRKSQDRIALWIKGCEEETARAVGLRWKVALEVSDKTTVRFQCHKDAERNNSSYKNQVLFEV